MKGQMESTHYLLNYYKCIEIAMISYYNLIKRRCAKMASTIQVRVDDEKVGPFI